MPQVKKNTQLNVIQGDWVACPNWLNFPDTIEARSPILGLDSCQLRISKTDIIKAAGLRRRVPAYVLWSVLLGQAPPVPHQIKDAEEGLSRLKDAHACYQGIKRPCADDENGDNFTAFVMKPKWVIEPDFRPPLLLGSKVELPADVVFVAYAKLDTPPRQHGTLGVLTHWNFVDADKRNLLLPARAKDRFEKRLW
jgi:hypothetical protein